MEVVLTMEVAEMVMGTDEGAEGRTQPLSHLIMYPAPNTQHQALPKVQSQVRTSTGARNCVTCTRTSGSAWSSTIKGFRVA